MITLSNVFDITSFGAISGSSSTCTHAFSSAVQACVEKGGGTIYVPAGTFLTGPIHLKSNINLHLAAGSKLLFSTSLEHYPIVSSRWEGSECLVYMPMIYGREVENVAISGFGTIDAQGEYWWENFKAGTLNYPRPRLISFEDSSRLIFEGIQLINSPSWTINPIRCNNITIDKITIKNPPSSPNTDGINPDSCKNVRISNCHIDVGDDCIAIKSGTEKSLYQVPCENIVITNCTLIHGHGGVVIGSEMSGGIRNVLIANCIFEGTDRGIRLKTRRGRGGLVQDVNVSNVIMREVMCPIVMHQYYFCGTGGKEKTVWDKAPYPVSEGTPVFKNINFSNITAVNAHAAAAFVYGLTEMPIEDITFNNITISMADNAVPGLPAMMKGLEPAVKKGFYCCNLKNALFSHVTVKGHEGPAFHMENSENIRFLSCSPEEESAL